MKLPWLPGACAAHPSMRSPRHDQTAAPPHPAAQYVNINTQRVAWLVGMLGNTDTMGGLADRNDGKYRHNGQVGW